MCSQIQGNEQERFSVCDYSKLTSWLLPWLQHDHVTSILTMVLGCCVNLILRESLLRSESKLIQVVPEKAFILADGSQALAWSESGKDEQYDQYTRPFFGEPLQSMVRFFCEQWKPPKKMEMPIKGVLGCFAQVGLKTQLLERLSEDAELEATRGPGSLVILDHL